jgi:hypothetical protein
MQKGSYRAIAELIRLEQFADFAMRTFGLIVDLLKKADSPQPSAHFSPRVR